MGGELTGRGGETLAERLAEFLLIGRQRVIVIQSGYVACAVRRTSARGAIQRGLGIGHAQDQHAVVQ